MTDAAEAPVESSLEVKLKESLRDIFAYIDDSSEHQKRRLWLLLEDVTSGEWNVETRLRSLLKNHDSLAFLDDASEDKKRKLLLLLEDMRASDRREHPRKSCLIGVSYTVHNQVFTDVVRNISAGGVFIVTSVPLFVRQQLPLAISLPSWDQPLRMMGQVVWKSPVGVGVKFTSPPRQELMELIESL